MSSPISARCVEPHFACLDIVQINCNPVGRHQLDFSQIPGRPSLEDAVLLEIWEHGAVVQTSFPIAKGSAIVIIVKHKEVTAWVTRCVEDHEFGFLVDVDINTSNAWFPNAYVPAWQEHEGDIVLHCAGFIC